MRKNDEPVLISLNEKLNTEFSIHQLEERLETDPLMFGNPLDASVQMSNADCFTLVVCFTYEPR